MENGFEFTTPLACTIMGSELLPGWQKTVLLASLRRFVAAGADQYRTEPDERLYLRPVRTTDGIVLIPTTI